MTTALFIHGFLDDENVWDDVVSTLPGDVNTIRYALPGFGARVDESTDISLASLAAEAGALIADVDGDVIVVGQSMGSQIAELVATDHPEKVTGLVLITPVPLTGTHLDAEVTAPFRALGGDPDAQRTARKQLSPNLTDDQLDRLTPTGVSARPEVVSRYVDVWNDGVPDAPPVSAFTGPVLLIRGGADTFVTAELVATVSPRFPQARQEVIDGGGHWVHVEYADRVAAMIAAFVQETAAAAGWRRSFAEKSADRFAETFAEHIVFEATTLPDAVQGRDQVAATLAAASTIYESLEFTAEVHSGSTSYLQWRATAFDGMAMSGVTILDRDADGKIVKLAIHHRPLGAVLRFAAEIQKRTEGVRS
ncbi:pimeloyl-ACP methyl ester carboxylesterase [Mycobacterium frederiksbergense]|uniref:Pimeloyl-ACP methyl ester carboxylesterase n=1 Tax=Mycolicibacterium frederiksbergense TaxID=117567 RepID=A0ABT6L8L2_9MYCO|nr:alpha/beta fold hydrolase [Mycolicibacterium frederiksbergense]MDH6198320.1 pimeloyl-ACP methyl ester carboxylesterase [Mycolicibacterium frederiksbergense]